VRRLLRTLQQRPSRPEQAERQNDNKSSGKTGGNDPKQGRETPLALIKRYRLFVRW
jgi:hypothetical protein